MDPHQDADAAPTRDVAPMADDAWDSLLRRIAEGRVVPVIGSQLLVGMDGRSTSTKVAARLLALHRPQTDVGSLPAGRELDETIALLRTDARIGRINVLYEKVYDAIVEVTADDAAIPPPIVKLAAVTDFRLLVTVTSDNMLARCLAMRKHTRLNEIVHSPNASMAEASDLPPDWKDRRDDAYLLYLFGKAQRLARYAIHEEDVLEYAHNLIAGGNGVPAGFLRELLERDLLFIGCRFPDWLSRFFLRATNRSRLSVEREKREWMVERLEPGESLTLFLNSYSKDTEILSDMEPAAFVDELHRRWLLKRPAVPADGDAQAEAPPRGKLFFVSYARRSDQASAEAFVRALITLGLRPDEIWFDRLTVEPGDDFQQRIRAGIRQCVYFVPLLSEAAVAREEAIVLGEWRQATQRLANMGRKFLVPLVVDDAAVPDRYLDMAGKGPDWPVNEWSGLDFGHAPRGVPDERTLALFRTLVREAATTRLPKP